MLQAKYGYFSVDEIDYILSDSFVPQKANSVELYVRVFWEVLKMELSLTKIEKYDEYGNVIEREIDPHKDIISAKRLSVVIKDALQPFEDYAEKNCFDFMGTEIEFDNFQPLSEVEAMAIVDFNLDNNDSGKYYKIDKYRFVHLYSQEIPTIPYSELKKPEVREDDYRYMQKIYLLGGFDKGFNMLTVVEKGICMWIEKFLEVDEEGRVSAIKAVKTVKKDFSGLKEVSVGDYAWLEIDITKNHIDWGDFRKIFFRDEGVGSVSLVIRQFVHLSVQALHMKYGMESKVDKMSLDEVKDMIEGFKEKINSDG
jgi:hypothetical protein